MRNSDGIMEEVQWETAMSSLTNTINNINSPNDLLGLVGEFSSCESLTAFKDFMSKLNCDNFASHNFHFKSKVREDYLLNRTIPEFE